MVEVTALSGRTMFLNSALIERIEACPDTIITLTSGRKLLVRESVAEVVERLERERRSVWEACLSLASDSSLRREGLLIPETA